MGNVKIGDWLSQAWAIISEDLVTLEAIGDELLNGRRGDRTRQMIETTMRERIVGSSVTIGVRSCASTSAPSADPGSLSGSAEGSSSRTGSSAATSARATSCAGGTT